MTLPENLVKGQQYVVSIDVEKNGEDHPQLDPGDLVTLVNADVDDDGEVYVTATAVADDASIGAWVKTEYLMTLEEAEKWVEQNRDIAVLTSETFENSEDEEPLQFSYIPHPEYPNLPTYETLPLGYALGVVAFIKDLEVKPDPAQVAIMQYLQGRSFPTA